MTMTAGGTVAAAWRLLKRWFTRTRTDKRTKTIGGKKER